MTAEFAPVEQLSRSQSHFTAARDSQLGKDWLACGPLFDRSLFVVQKRSNIHQGQKVRSTLRSIGFKRINDFRLLGNNDRERGKLQVVARLVEVLPPLGDEALNLLCSRRGQQMTTLNFRDDEETRRLVRFKTSEYVTKEEYGDTGDVAVVWTTLITFAEALEVAIRHLKNDGEFHVFVSSEHNDPSECLTVGEARDILLRDQTQFLRVDSRSESFTFGSAKEEVSFPLREAALITEGYDTVQISSFMEQSASPMIRANISNVLQELGLTQSS